MRLHSSTAPDNLWPLRVHKSLYLLNPGPCASTDTIKMPVEARPLNHTERLCVFCESPPNKPQWNLSSSCCSQAPPWGHIGRPPSISSFHFQTADSGVPTMPSLDMQVVSHGGLPDICTPISNPHTVGLFHSIIQRMDLFWHLLTSASQTEHTHLPGLQTQKYSQAEGHSPHLHWRPWLPQASSLPAPLITPLQAFLLIIFQVCVQAQAWKIGSSHQPSSVDF